MDNVVNLTKCGKSVAIYEIIAGIIGILGSIPALFKTAPAGHTIGYYMMGILLVAASIASILGGILLYKKNTLGLSISYLVQILQVPVLVLKGLHFQLFLLAGLAIGIDAAKNFILKYFIGTKLFFAVGNIDFAYVGINILPLIIVFLLMGALKKE